MADEYEEEDGREVVENPRHEAARRSNRSGGKWGFGARGTSGYMKPARQTIKELSQALDEDTPAVKQRRVP
jgi:hypothetical protein